jgi:FMN phosphatase YigB (HAD superfamily)
VTRLKAAGIKVGAAGNMPADVERFLQSSGLRFDMIGSSEQWGAEKPNRRFFERVAEGMALPAQCLMYVGDRVDNDVRPAAAAGMAAIFLRRGPWARVLGRMQDASAAYAVIDSLDELPALLAPGSDGGRTVPNKIRKDRPASK